MCILVRKQVETDTEPTERIAAVLCHSLGVADEVVVDAARLTQLVHRSPVSVERLSGSRVDDVQNEFPERHRIVVSHIFAVFTFDNGCNPPKEPAVSTKRVHLYLHTQANVTAGGHSVSVDACVTAGGHSHCLRMCYSWRYNQGINSSPIATFMAKIVGGPSCRSAHHPAPRHDGTFAFSFSWTTFLAICCCDM